MAQSNAVTLTFLANTKPLTEGLRTVQSSAAQAEADLNGVSARSHQLGTALEEAGRQGRATREVMRGVGDAAMFMGGGEGQAIAQTVFLAGAVKDLSRGSGELIKSMGLLKLATGGVIAAIATAGVAVSAHIDHTSMLNEIHRTAADSAYYLADGIAHVANVIPGVNTNLGGLVGWLDKASQSAHGLGDEAFYSAQELQKLAAAKEASLFQAPDQNPGGDAFVTAADMQNIILNSYTRTSVDDPVARTSTAVRTGASKIKTAADEAAKTLKEAKASIASAVRSLAEAFKPTLDMSGPAGGYSRVGDTSGGRGGGLIGNLRKQAQDTLKLRKDLERLSKAGLDKNLLSQLVAGGLASLPAAEDLLSGGAGEIKLANKYDRQITGNANTIAAEQTARNLTKADKAKLEINVKGGDAELVKLVRKWVKSNGGNVQAVLGG